MARRILVIEDAFDYGADGPPNEDARVVADEAGVTILPHDSDEPVSVTFSREEWDEVVNFVRWVWSPPTMGGRE